jgi:hypothetical protein
MSTSIDLDFRPRSYFWPLSAEKHLLSTIRGEERRLVVQAAFNANDLDALTEFFAKPSLSEAERTAIGRVHPQFMGGEYLPNLRGGEIEIARINIDSVTSDVTSVYARRTSRGISYRVVDEYDGDTLNAKTKRTSRLPLTLGDLTNFFLAAWPLDSVLEWNELDEEGSQEFVHPSSEFYPGFGGLIRQKIGEWRAVELEDDELEDDELRA